MVLDINARLNVAAVSVNSRLNPSPSEQPGYPGYRSIRYHPGTLLRSRYRFHPYARPRFHAVSCSICGVRSLLSLSVQPTVSLRRQQEDDTLAAVLEGLAGLQLADEDEEAA
jgi:hypothetical protein